MSLLLFLFLNISASQWNALAPKDSIRNMAILRYTENLGFDAVYYRYNSMNQVISVTSAAADRQHTSWYSMDQYGRTKQVSSALSNFNGGLGITSVHYPTPLAQPSQPDILYTFNTIGLLELTTYPAINLSVARTYNDRKRPFWLQATRSGSGIIEFVQMLDYYAPNPANPLYPVYDGTGQIWGTSWAFGAPWSHSQSYGYDNVDRLIEWKQGTFKETYEYDAIGNRLFRDNNNGPTDYWYYQGQNRLMLAQTGNLVLGHDYNANGAVSLRQKEQNSQTIHREEMDYTADGLLRENQIVVNEHGSPYTWGYRYSPSGEREQKRMFGTLQGQFPSPILDTAAWVYYLLGGDSKQLALYYGEQTKRTNCGWESNPSVYFFAAEYMTYGIGGTAEITMKRDIYGAWRKHYNIKDNLGSTRVVIQDDGLGGAVMGHYDYTPWGEALTGEAPRKGFIDKEKDKESGDQNFGVRQYDDDIARFTSVDPLWEAYLGMSPYAYAANNPLKFIDPTGLVLNINGTDAQRAFDELQTQVGMNLSFNNNKVSMTDDNYIPRNIAETRLIDEINNPNIAVNLNTTRSSQIVQGGETIDLNIGAFGGSTRDAEGHITAEQTVNLEQADKGKLVDGGDVGKTILHESLEAYIGAQQHPGEGYSSANFNAAHSATISIAPIPELRVFAGNTGNTGYVGIQGPTGSKILLFTKDMTTGRVISNLPNARPFR